MQTSPKENIKKESFLVDVHGEAKLEERER